MWFQLTKRLSITIIRSAPNCIKDFLDLPDDIGQSGLTLQLFPMVILVVIRFDVKIVSTGNNCNVKPDWPEQMYCPMKMLYTIGCSSTSCLDTTHFDFIMNPFWFTWLWTHFDLHDYEPILMYIMRAKGLWLRSDNRWKKVWTMNFILDIENLTQTLRRVYTFNIYFYKHRRDKKLDRKHIL